MNLIEEIKFQIMLNNFCKQIDIFVMFVKEINFEKLQIYEIFNWV